MVRKPQPPNSACADVSSSHPFFVSACHLVGRSLCACAACYACFACALTARGLAQAPQGTEDDASGDGSSSNPYQSLSKCVDAAGDHGTCYLKGGRYARLRRFLDLDTLDLHSLLFRGLTEERRCEVTRSGRRPR